MYTVAGRDLFSKARPLSQSSLPCPSLPCLLKKGKYKNNKDYRTQKLWKRRGETGRKINETPDEQEKEIPERVKERKIRVDGLRFAKSCDSYQATVNQNDRRKWNHQRSLVVISDAHILVLTNLAFGAWD